MLSGQPSLLHPVDRRAAAARDEAAAAAAALVGAASPAYPGVSRVELVRALADSANDVTARIGAEVASATQALATAAHAAQTELVGRAAQIAAEASEATRGAVVRELVPPLALLADGLHDLRSQLLAEAARRPADGDAEAQRLLAELAAAAAREGVRDGLEGLEARVAALLKDAAPPPPPPPPAVTADEEESPFGSDRSTLSSASEAPSHEGGGAAAHSEGEVSSLGEGGAVLAFLGAPLRHLEGGGGAGGLGFTASAARRLPPPGWTVDPSDLSAGEVVLLPPGPAEGGGDDDDYSVGELVELLPVSLGRRGDDSEVSAAGQAQGE